MNFCHHIFIFPHGQEFQNYTVARDAFLAHLGSTLWGSMRHIISPSIADGAFHHYEKISFQLYFITQEVWCALQNLNKLQWNWNFTPERIFFLFSFFRCRKSEILNYCLWISRLSMMDFPLCYYPLRKLCSVSICMHPSLLFDFFSFCFK